MLVYRVGLETATNENECIDIRIDEHNTDSYEEDRFNAILSQCPDVKKVKWIDYIGNDEDEDWEESDDGNVAEKGGE